MKNDHVYQNINPNSGEREREILHLETMKCMLPFFHSVGYFLVCIECAYLYAGHEQPAKENGFDKTSANEFDEKPSMLYVKVVLRRTVYHDGTHRHETFSKRTLILIMSRK